MASSASHTACRSFLSTRCVHPGSGFSQQAVHRPWRPSECQCGRRHDSPLRALEAGDKISTAGPPAPLNSETVVSGAFLSLLSSSSGAPNSGGPLVTALRRLPSEGSPNGRQQESSLSGSSPWTSGSLQVHCRLRGKGKSWSSTRVSGAMTSDAEGKLEAAVSGKSQDGGDGDQHTRRAPASGLVDHDSATSSCDSGSAHSGTEVGICVTSGASQELQGRRGTQAAGESGLLAGATETSSTASSPAGQSFTSPVPRLVKKPEPPWKPDPSDCCGSGCDPCIFDIYYQELEEYHRLLKLWEDQQGHGNSPPGSDLEST